MTLSPIEFARMETLAQSAVGFEVQLEWLWPLRNGVVTAWTTSGVWPARRVSVCRSGAEYYVVNAAKNGDVSDDLKGFEKLINDLPLNLGDTSTFCEIWDWCAPFMFRLLKDDAPEFVRRDIEFPWHPPRYEGGQLIAFFNDFLTARCVRLTIRPDLMFQLDDCGKGIAGHLA